MPAELLWGLEAFTIDPHWQWVLVDGDQVKAQMLCVNAHGILMMLRLTALPDAPAAWAVRLFREVLREARSRGCIGFMTFLADSNPQELKLMRIAQRHGSYFIPQSGAWVAGSTDGKY